MMRTGLTALAATVMVLASTGPAEAQRYRVDFGVNGGGSWYRPSLDEDHLNSDIAEARFEPGWLAGAQLTYWVPSVFGLRDRLGIRANFAYTERPFELETDNNETIDGAGDGDNLVEDVNLWSGTGDLMFRFMGPNAERFAGTEWMPYLALGLGAKWVDPAFNNGPRADGEDEGTVFGIGDRFFLLEESSTLMGLVGLGTDIRVARNFAFRAEIGDRIWDSPIVALQPDGNGGFDRDEDEDTGNVIHEIYGQLGAHLLFGLARERVAVLPPPAPAPPAPTEEAITVCVIDPATGGIRNVSAIYVPSTRDTLVVMNGRRQSLGTAFPENAPLYVRNAEWFTAGRPLTVSVAGERSEWVSFGGARVIDAGDLALLGTVNGTPVFADADEVEDIREQLDDLREEGDDLEEILEQNQEIREEIDELDVVYVPLSSGCVFQPLRRVEEVRKIRG